MFQFTTITKYSDFFTNNEASHVQDLNIFSSTVTMAYDDLNRRLVKEGLAETVYHYDLFGNLIGESKRDGSFIRDWVYIGNQRLAMIVGPGDTSGGGTGCGGVPGGGGCSLGGGTDGGAAFLVFMGLIFLGIGVVYKRKKYTIAGLTFIGGVLFLVLMPEAKSQTATESIYYYHNDHLGTPKVLTNEAAVVVWDVNYAPFGKISSYVTNGLTNTDQPFRFPGQYQDSLTGMYYNWNRYYMPNEGRYNRVDPLVESPEVLQSISLVPQYSFGYKYVSNNSILYYDFYGLCKSCDSCQSAAWHYEGVEYGGFLFIGGAKTSHITAHCIGNNQKSFSLKITCLGAGAGLGGSINANAGLTIGCDEKAAKNSLLGFQSCFSLYPPIIVPPQLGFGIGFCGGHSGGLTPGYGIEASGGGYYCFKRG
jgi:RHS repeat-associated protein